MKTIKTLNLALCLKEFFKKHFFNNAEKYSTIPQISISEALLTIGVVENNAMIHPAFNLGILMSTS